MDTIFSARHTRASKAEKSRKCAAAARAVGFTGKGSINPKQVPIINDIFSPNEDEVKKAKRILKVFEEANTGLVMVDGKLIETQGICISER